MYFLLFEIAHPAVVTFPADRTDLLFGIVDYLFGRPSNRDSERPKVLSSMNPCTPQVLPASGLLVAKQTMMRHSPNLSCSPNWDCNGLLHLDALIVQVKSR